MSRKFWENVASLYGVHIASYIIPLFTLPYLARVLKPVEWGALAFAEAYSLYMTLVIEYGFGMSATREIACVRDDPNARARQLSGVIGAQVLLAAAAVAVTACLGRVLPIFVTHQKLVPAALLLALGRAGSPMWYFQGIERMRLMAVINIAANAAAAAGIFVLVQSPGDGWMSLVLRGGAALLATVAGFLVAHSDTPFLWPTFARSKEALRQGGSLFLLKSSVTLYTTLNVLILGIVAAPAAVAWYAGAEKISKAAIGGTGPMAQAFYPHINHLFASDRARAARALRTSAWFMLGLGMTAGLALFAGAPLLVRLLLGSGYHASIPVLRVLALLPPMLSASNLLGTQWMLPLRMDREFNVIILLAGLLNVGLALILARRYGSIGMAVSVACAETLVASGTLFALRRRRLDPWSVKQVVEQYETADSAIATVAGVDRD